MFKLGVLRLYQVCKILGTHEGNIFARNVQMTNDEKNTALFGSLVLMFQTAAMQQMGKMKNQVTDKIERNMEQAQLSIDMMDMLSVKMKGNLSSEESSYLSNALRELKLNYVDERAKDQASKKETL